MADIIRIIIKGESGYGPVDEAFTDKVTIDLDSIRYEYKPVVESKINVPRKWSYKTSSPIFQKRFKEVADSVETILHWEEKPFVTDIGVTTFAVTYAVTYVTFLVMLFLFQRSTSGFPFLISRKTYDISRTNNPDSVTNSSLFRTLQ